MIETVELPVGEKAALGIMFQGCPPVVESFAENSSSKLCASLHRGLYVHKLIVPGLEISFFQDSEQLRETLNVYRDVAPKFLVLSDAQPEERPTLYSVSLPSGKLKGLGFKGFPPVITTVDETFPLAGVLQPGQVVDRYVVPSRDVDFSLASGGFTNTNLARVMQETFDAEDRQLVVKYHLPQTPKSQRSSNSALDWDSFRVIWPTWHRMWGGAASGRDAKRRAPGDRSGLSYGAASTASIVS
mmetsp:Transcript_5668/g.7957  ORF Transcript_5668/g.7957 Transcript_5668/m.7957 type:complete len:243 (-) Transcript_5668:1403-2131(-)